jgi:hypothetical protein
MDRLLEELDRQIMDAFPRYKRYLDEGTFRGREREAVSFFSFGYLTDEMIGAIIASIRADCRRRDCEAAR